VLHTLPISFSLTWSFQLYMAKSTSYEAPQYAVISEDGALHYHRCESLKSYVRTSNFLIS
jgi:hypothetical protein